MKSQNLRAATDEMFADEEMRRVVGLLGELPRVAAPADFDFRLRARIATAKSAQREEAGFWAGLFSRSFSWGQAAAVTAAAALLVSFTTFEVLHSNKETINNDLRPSVASAKLPNRVSEATPANPPASIAPQAQAAPAAVASARPVSVKHTPKAAPALNNALESSRTPITTTNFEAETMTAGNAVMIKNSRGEARMMPVGAEYSFGIGAQVSSRPTPAAQESVIF